MAVSKEERRLAEALCVEFTNLLDKYGIRAVHPVQGMQHGPGQLVFVTDAGLHITVMTACEQPEFVTKVWYSLREDRPGVT